MHEEFGREAVVHTHGVNLVHLGGDTWVTSGTSHCPCSHLEQVEAVSADVGETGEGCGVVKASAEIINYICSGSGTLILSRVISESTVHHYRYEYLYSDFSPIGLRIFELD